MTTPAYTNINQISSLRMFGGLVNTQGQLFNSHFLNLVNSSPTLQNAISYFEARIGQNRSDPIILGTGDDAKAANAATDKSITLGSTYLIPKNADGTPNTDPKAIAEHFALVLIHEVEHIKTHATVNFTSTCDPNESLESCLNRARDNEGASRAAEMRFIREVKIANEPEFPGEGSPYRFENEPLVNPTLPRGESNPTLSNWYALQDSSLRDNPSFQTAQLGAAIAGTTGSGAGKSYADTWQDYCQNPASPNISPNQVGSLALRRVVIGN